MSLGDVPAHRLNALGPKLLADLTMTDRRLIDKALNSAAPAYRSAHRVPGLRQRVQGQPGFCLIFWHWTDA